jgi:DNA-binding response OmpR family regulator
VVDDDQELRENLGEILGEAGFLVTLATNGETALDALDKEAFDVVLLDLLMPAMDGREALGLIKRRRPQTRVIMMTAFATIESAVSMMRKGADDYLTKPFKVDELITSVRRVLEEARMQGCREVINAEETFNCLANVMRREILVQLHQEGPSRFMDITRRLGVEDHTKVNFHLKILREAGFVEQDSKKFYQLSAEGRRIINCMQTVIGNLAPPL